MRSTDRLLPGTAGPVVAAGAPAGLSRRSFIALLPLALAACTASGTGEVAFDDGIDPFYRLMYGPQADTPFPIAAVDLTRIDPTYLRRDVDLPSYVPNEPGRVVVDPRNRFVFFVQPGNRATRYGAGVGREGFAWNGGAAIRDKRPWPTWTPPPAMVARDPNARPWAAGMPGGPENPLGARALYLYQGNRDTLYRIHGTNQPWTIGTAASSGCIRMLNHDIVDLYNRVPIGTRVTVLA